MPYEALTKARLLQALRRLGELAHAEGLTLEVSLYGGAVFTLVYGSRDTTKDVDALVRPAAEGKRLAAVVAQEQNLPEDWLNDHVRQFVAAKEEKRGLTEEDFGPGLKVSAPTAAYLLALKLRACRAPLPGYAGDEADILFLLRRIHPEVPRRRRGGICPLLPGGRLGPARAGPREASTQGTKIMTPRPLTLTHVAQRSDTLEEFGRHFQDWLHTLRTLTSRPRVEAAVREAPPRLARRFPEGRVADAWLAAYAEHTANSIGRTVPEWTDGRVSPEPWFAVSSTDTASRLAALRDSPAPFKCRNLFTPSVDLPLALSAGRPAKTKDELRQANAERQKKFRARRLAELTELRNLAGRRKSSPNPKT